MPSGSESASGTRRRASIPPLCGLFLIVINGFLFWLADKIVEGVEVDGFGACVLGSVITTVISWLISWALGLSHLSHHVASYRY